MCVWGGGGGGRVVGINKEYRGNEGGGVVHKNIKGPCRGSDNFYRDTIKILLIPPPPSSPVIVFKNLVCSLDYFHLMKASVALEI